MDYTNVATGLLYNNCVILWHFKCCLDTLLYTLYLTGLLLDQIIKNISAAADPGSKQEVKMIVYSAHDSTVVALQEALDVFSGFQPPYASCHIIELHQEKNGSFSIEMFYRNDSSVSEPYAVSLPGCSQRCPLQDFLNLTRDVIPQDWNRECQIGKDTTDTEVIIGLAICGCLLFLLVLLLLVLLCRQKEPTAGYSHVINESDSWQSYRLLRKEEFWDSEEDLWGHSTNISKKLKANADSLHSFSPNQLYLF